MISEQVDAIVEKIGADQPQDNLITSKLDKIIEKLGGTIPDDNLITSKLDAIFEVAGGCGKSLNAHYLPNPYDSVILGSLPEGFDFYFIRQYNTGDLDLVCSNDLEYYFGNDNYLVPSNISANVSFYKIKTSKDIRKIEFYKTDYGKFDCRESNNIHLLWLSKPIKVGSFTSEETMESPYKMYELFYA